MHTSEVVVIDAGVDLGLLGPLELFIEDKAVELGEGRSGGGDGSLSLSVTVVDGVASHDPGLLDLREAEDGGAGVDNQVVIVVDVENIIGSPERSGTDLDFEVAERRVRALLAGLSADTVPLLLEGTVRLVVLSGVPDIDDGLSVIKEVLGGVALAALELVGAVVHGELVPLAGELFDVKVLGDGVA